MTLVDALDAARRYWQRIVVPVGGQSTVYLSVFWTGALAFMWGLPHGDSPRAPEQSAPPARAVGAIVTSAGEFQPTHRYVGVLEPWNRAQIGPQYISAYATEVRFRAGATVHSGETLALLDCRAASAEHQALTAQANAARAWQSGVTAEASRVTGLLPGHFVSDDVAQRRQADSASEQSLVREARAQADLVALSVRDCVLRAPFDGDIGERFVDPGTFVSPGVAMLTVVDRSVVRATAEVGENDFGAVAPGRSIQLEIPAAQRTISARVTRRASAANATTHTVHIEIDLPNPDGTLPTNTSAVFVIEHGSPIHGTAIPVNAVGQLGDIIRVVTATGGVARIRRVRRVGEQNGLVLVDSTQLPPETLVITDGASSILDGDHVVTHETGER